MKTKCLISLAVLSALLGLQGTAVAQGTLFNYNGQLVLSDQTAASGLYDFAFALYDAETNGNPIGNTNYITAPTDANGGFVVSLDFGMNVFDGTLRWLEVSVKTNTGATYASLAPRQPIQRTFVAQDMSAERAIIGVNNDVSGVLSSILGGTGNTNTSAYAVICGGVGNSDSGANNFIGGGEGNKINGANTCFIVGGRTNTINVNAHRSGIGGGEFNWIGAYSQGSLIGGGSRNTNWGGGYNQVIGGGYQNLARADRTTIGGGGYNTIWDSGLQATIGGGLNNTIHANGATIAGGVNNTNSSAYDTIGGGYQNFIQGNSSTATRYATIGGGYKNRINTGAEYATIGGGRYNVAGGYAATVPGGEHCEATAGSAFAAGFYARAKHPGAFVWGDSSSVTYVESTGNNQFIARASGGVKFYSKSDLSAGVQLLPNQTAWSSISDREVKKNRLPINPQEVLDKLTQVPVEQWLYRWEDDSSTPHIGPMAQDFKAAFYPGRDDKTISTMELDGVALAAIQGLNQKVEEKEARIADLERSVVELKALVQQLADENRKGAK